MKYNEKFKNIEEFTKFQRNREIEIAKELKDLFCNKNDEFWGYLANQHIALETALDGLKHLLENKSKDV